MYRVPKITPYPNVSLTKCLDLLDRVHQAGGSLTAEKCARLMGRAVSGHFNLMVGSAVKFGLVTHHKGTITIAEIGSRISLAYTNEERQLHLQEAFFRPELYGRLVGHLNAIEGPHFDKILVREFGVQASHARAILNTLKEDLGHITGLNSASSRMTKIQNKDATAQSYQVKIVGPGLTTEFTIRQPSDVDLLQSVVEMLKRQFS